MANRRTRRALRRRRPSVPPVVDNLAGGAGATPSKAAAALFLAQRLDCNCEVCEILREAADEVIEAAGVDLPPDILEVVDDAS